MLPYLGRQLAMVRASCPTPGASTAVEARLDGAELQTRARPAAARRPSTCEMPRFQFTTQRELSGAAQRRWARRACSTRARPQLPGITADEPLWRVGVRRAGASSRPTRRGPRRRPPPPSARPPAGPADHVAATWTGPSWWPWSTGPAASRCCSDGSSTRCPDRSHRRSDGISRRRSRRAARTRAVAKSRGGVGRGPAASTIQSEVEPSASSTVTRSTASPRSMASAVLELGPSGLAQSRPGRPAPPRRPPRWRRC